MGISAAESTKSRRARGYSSEDLDTILGITDEEKVSADAAIAELERQGQVWRGPLDATAEGRVLLANPAFQEALAAGRRVSGTPGKPETPATESRQPSGRLLLRLSRSVHGQLAERAAQEGVSINQLILHYVSRGLGTSEAHIGPP